MNQMMGTVGNGTHTVSENVDRRSETSALALRARLIEVEAEHLRLQRLVAELLIKNQKLRELLCEQAGTSAAAASFCRDGEAGHPRHASSH